MQNARDCSVVAVFTKAGDARDAQAELQAAGFKADRIYSSADAAAAAASAMSTRPEGHIAHWLKSLFGGEEHSHFHGYQRALSSGQYVVGVDTSDEDSVKGVGDLCPLFADRRTHR